MEYGLNNKKIKIGVNDLQRMKTIEIYVSFDLRG